MLRRSASPFLALLVVISFILQCDLPQDPTDPSNTRVELLIRNSLGLQSNSSITDTVDNPIRIGLAFYLTTYIDSIKFTVKGEGKVIYDTMLRSFSTRIKDTIWKSMSFPDSGYKLVSIVPYSRDVTLMPVSADITIVKKTSTTQPGNHPPKWSDTTLPVALNDTARYELNLSALCSDPDKDLLRYAISGKTLPGDTIIDSLYVFQASSETIGKNSIELIASDLSGLKDTMELVLNVTASGTDANPPEVTITAPDRDSSVINSENFVLGLLCSDASGIDSVYAVFNGKTTSAVLENGHYKINITGLVAGVYNIIELTVRDKSINALKTTKTIKIKYVQRFAIAYNGNGNSSGVVPTDTGKYETGATATVKGNTGILVKTGYVFAGWNTAADGSGTAYAVGASLIMGTKDVTLFARWTQNATFTVTYDGNTNSSGAVPADLGKYENGVTVTVKSNSGNLVKTGYTFVGWATSASGTEVYKGEETFKIGANDVTLYAIWKQNTTYTLTITSTNGQVTILPNATVFDSGTIVTLTPVPLTGYHFTGWSGALSGTTNPATITMGSAQSVTAIFEANSPNTFALTVLAPNGTVQKAPDQTQYNSGSVVVLTAVPNAGYQFTGWSGGITGTTNPSSVTMNEAKTVTANFVIKTFALSVTATNGSVTKLPDANSFDSGTVVTLTAVPDVGYQFTGWSGGLTGTTNPSSVTMSAAKSVTANFALKTFALSVSATNGTVSKSPNADTYDSGTVVKLTAVPAAGYQFTGWSGDLTGTTNPTSVTMNTAKSVTAKFALKTFALSVTATNGSVTKLPDANSYDSGTGIKLTAVPAAGYQFTGWSGDLTGTTNPTSVTMNTAKSVTAKFALKTFALSITATGGSVTKSPDANSYDSGTVVKLIAVPDDGYQFAGWSGGITETKNTASVTMDAEKKITAKFTPITFTLTYDGNGSSGSAPSSVTGIESGTSVTVSGVGSLIRDGYEFLGWSTDQYATTAEYNSSKPTITITANTKLYAIWKLLPTFTVTYNANGGGSVGGHGSGNVPTDSKAYATNANVSVLANPGNLTRIGYVFRGWSKDINAKSTISSFKMENANVILYARWVIVDIDGNEYDEVKIGSQVWMVQNLKTTKLNNGQLLPKFSSDRVASYVPSTYGFLYNGYCFMDDTSSLLAPSGWRAAGSEDWSNLLMSYNSDNKGLASKEYWDVSTRDGAVGCQPSANNVSGFTAYPDGGAYAYGDPYQNNGVGKWATFWVSGGVTGLPFLGTCYTIPYDDPAHYIDKMSPEGFFSVRCVREY
jgi:uncharacterized protein (TIGR02145 family)/uncharacterized repeat protein (TIGR02543 family)